MLTGTADVGHLTDRAATLVSFDRPSLTLPGAEVLQAGFEMRYASRQALLPPALHPTTPPVLVVLAWRCPSSPWGAFQLAQVRVACRSGVRPRGLVAGCIVDNADAAQALAADYGIASMVGNVELKRYYDRVDLSAGVDGALAIEMIGADPDPLGLGDVQYTVTMTLAHTPLGVRLVQLEPDYAPTRVERLQPRLRTFDGAVWGEPLLTPFHGISASVALASITIPTLRYVCRPDVLAFEGTESVR
ncbi:MAG TPA: hypothetical protein VNY84_07030 [Acidimicrobiales bacterium]|nr:hypothetical protein [Acidimicrobiales bacterium]